MKSKAYLFRFLLIAGFLVIAHLLLIYVDVIPADFAPIFKLDIVVFSLFALGTIVIAPGLDKAPDSFVNRFLILTTFQMLAMMSILLALVYVKTPNFQQVGFHTISIFVLLLIVQSILLVRFVNQSK